MTAPVRKGVSSSRGFTMIELIVVVAIIAILSVFLITTFSRSHKEARDNRRKADLKSIHSALEYFYLENGFYPTSPSYSDTSILSGSLTPRWLVKIPDDPHRDQDYYYTSRVAGHTPEQNCCLSAKMELEENARDFLCEGYAEHGENVYTVSCR